MLMKVNVERLREGILLRVIVYAIQLAFHTQDLEIITNNVIERRLIPLDPLHFRRWLNVDCW